MNFAHVGDTPEVIVPLDGAENVRNALGIRCETDRIDLDASSRGAGLDDEGTCRAFTQAGACLRWACHPPSWRCDPGAQSCRPTNERCRPGPRMVAGIRRQLVRT